MSGSVLFIDSVRNGVNDVISNHFTKPPKIQVNQASVSGDGYSAKTCAITLNGSGQNVDIFVKYLPEREFPKDIFALTRTIFSNEHKSYGEIFPAMIKFQEERGVKNPFTNVPKYFKTNLKDGEVPPVFLENIKSKGYELRDRKQPIDEKHIELVLTTYAKFHAVSFAMKDQKPELFNSLSHGLSDMFSLAFKNLGMDEMLSRAVDQLKKSTDPIAEKKLYDRLHNLAEDINLHCSTLDHQADEYAAIGQGDSWSNNMMFLYDNTTGNPIDIKLVDWQGTRLNSPILDVAYFFYTVATKEELQNIDKYMKLYYDTLSSRIKALGSDPEKLYPESIFKQHWKKLSKFGLGMAFLIIKILLYEDDEIPNMIDSSDMAPDATLFCAAIKKEDVYLQRLKDLLEHFIDRDFL